MPKAFPDPVLVAIPAYGAPELTDAVLEDLLGDGFAQTPSARVVVVDNLGEYAPAQTDPRLTVHRPGRNLRWIGSANWALDTAAAEGAAVCVVLNNDIRLSSDFLAALVQTFLDCPEAAVAAACYDDFWLHQRAREIPARAAAYVPVASYRDVPFCDGTALAFAVPRVAALGPLDGAAFPRHGYGADIDYSLRAREAGLRCVVTEAAYVAHRRRGTMDRLPGETRERNRHEILTGLDRKWGDGWRARAGLGPDAFPPHNTGSAASWYLEAPRW